MRLDGPPGGADFARVVSVVATPCPPGLRPSTAWLVVTYLILHAHSFPRRKDIAKHFGCTAETVTRWIDALIEVGIVRKDGRVLSLDIAKLDSYLEKSVIGPWDHSAFSDLSNPQPPLTTTSTTTTPFPRNTSPTPTIRPSEPPSDLNEHTFVTEVAELRRHRIPVDAGINASDILELLHHGLDIGTATDAARITFKAGKRRFDYWEGVVRHKLGIHPSGLSHPATTTSTNRSSPPFRVIEGGLR